MGKYTIRLSHWMEDLPDDVKRRPLNYLTIPGSHDSLTTDITYTSPAAPDLEECLQGVYELMPGSRFLVSPFFRKWCRTQSGSVVDQLKGGIRYFDLRVAPKEKSKVIAIVHGLYSCDLEPKLKKLNDFLNSHSKELVILDFQHFYDFTPDLHKRLIDMIKTIFAGKLSPKLNTVTDSLSQMVSRNNRVIAVYREDDYAENDRLLWERGHWPSAWPNTMSPDRMIEYAESRLKYRSTEYGFITQMILTPDKDAIERHPLSGVKDLCAQKVLPVIVSWLKDKGREFSPCVVIADFVNLEKNSFTTNTITLNFQNNDSLKFVK